MVKHGNDGRGPRRLWILLAAGAAIFILVTFTGSVLMIGTQLRAVHPWVETGFYAGMAILGVVLIGAPLIAVIRAPVLALDEAALGRPDVDPRLLDRVATRLLKSGRLPKDLHRKLAGALQAGGAVRTLLAEALTQQRASATTIIHAQATLVFVSTAVSQSGRLDSFAVLAANLRLVRQLVDHYGYRPSAPVLARTYAQIFLAALIADSLDDLDLEGLLEQLGLTSLTVIPGTTLIVNSVLDGMVNALLTLRVGYITEHCVLNAGQAFDRSTVRRAANRAARRQLLPVMRDALPAVPTTIGDMFRQFVS